MLAKGTTTVLLPHRKGIALNYDYFNQGSCTRDTTLKIYLEKLGIIREDGGIDVAFTEPQRFPLEIDSLLYKRGLPLSYYSFFAFPKSLSGREEYKKEFRKIFDEEGITL